MKDRKTTCLLTAVFVALSATWSAHAAIIVDFSNSDLIHYTESPGNVNNFTQAGSFRFQEQSTPFTLFANLIDDSGMTLCGDGHARANKPDLGLRMGFVGGDGNYEIWIDF